MQPPGPHHASRRRHVLIEDLGEHLFKLAHREFYRHKGIRIHAPRWTHGLDSVPFTADDLPEYAGRLFDYCQAHPDVIRLATWHRLERGDQNPTGATPTRDAKLEALAAVQKANNIGSGFSPTALLTLVLSIALAWNPSNAAGMSAPDI
ncbi:hypothetical protein [Nocardia fluminea]|uniref:hypothetical protein n=1 Tax=Nocardia fluminea TaxID=134984 RepID=UPI00340747AA